MFCASRLQSVSQVYRIIASQGSSCFRLSTRTHLGKMLFIYVIDLKHLLTRLLSFVMCSGATATCKRRQPRRIWVSSGKAGFRACHLPLHSVHPFCKVLEGLLAARRLDRRLQRTARRLHILKYAQAILPTAITSTDNCIILSSHRNLQMLLTSARHFVSGQLLRNRAQERCFNNLNITESCIHA